jgi:hypothetical protein
MKTPLYNYIIIIIFLIRICYGKFNSYRIIKIGMQMITELYQFTYNNRKLKYHTVNSAFLECNTLNNKIKRGIYYENTYNSYCSFCFRY